VSLFIPGEPISLNFQVAGLPAGDHGRQLLVRVVDAEGTLLANPTLPVTADAQGKWQGTLPAPASRLGFYRVYAKLSTGEELPTIYTRPAGYLTYAIVPDPAQRQLYSDTDTYFGMQGGFDSKMEIIPYLGVREVLGGYNWADLEKDHAGQFAAAWAAAQAKGENYPAAWDLHFTENGQQQPWKVYSIPTFYAASWPKWVNTDSRAPLPAEDEKAFTDYLRAAAKAYAAAYPDREQHLYQVTWEPIAPWGWHGTDEQLIHIFELAYPVLHEADPKAFVIGPTGGDLPWSPAPGAHRPD
jgi:hypothetical protein